MHAACWAQHEYRLKSCAMHFISLASGFIQIYNIMCLHYFQIVIAGCTKAELEAALLGARIVALHRRGKHMWWELDRKPWPLWHFGMTGSFVIRGLAAPKYQSFAVDEKSWPPRFHKVLLGLSGGLQVWGGAKGSAARPG